MTRPLLIPLVLTLIGLLGCASGPPTPSAPAYPPAPQQRAVRTAPTDPLEVREFDHDGEVLVFPITTARADANRGLALSQLLVHALEVDRTLFPLGLGTTPEAAADTSVRYFVGGRMRRAKRAGRPLELDLWAMDRDSARVVTTTVTLDLPRLMAPRNALADLLTALGHGTSEHVRADMTFYEDLDLRTLDLAGQLVRARLAATPDATLVAHADTTAPWSFTIQAEVAHWVLGPLSGCSQAKIDRLSKLLALHRHLPTTLDTHAFDCSLESAIEDGPALPAWSVRSGAHCRVSGKGMTSIASTRGGVTGQHDQGFVTGLGGVYRGDSCDAGVAVMYHDPAELGPPIVRASLELEAAIYFYAERDLPKARRWFGRALETAQPEPACLVQLLAAEALLGMADLGIESGDAESRAHLAPARVIADRCGDIRMQGRIDNSEALYEQGASRFDKALRLLANAKAKFARIADATNLAVVEANLGVTWLQLGNVAKAVPHLDKALAGKRSLGSVGGIGVLLENLGVAALAKGDREAAARYFAEAIDYARDSHTIATLQVQLARLALARGDRKAAIEHMDLARKSSVRAHSRVLEAIVEQTTAAVSVDAGDYERAATEFHNALRIRREIGDRAGEGITLSLLMTVYDRMGQPAIASLYGKLAVAAHQDVRAAAGAIDAEAARDFLDSRADTYRTLARLLIDQGRLIEAERVMALLKEDEVSDWTRDAANPTKVPLTTAERDLDRRYEVAAGEVMRLGREYAALAAKWPRTKAEDTAFDKLRAAIEKANTRFSEFLASIAQAGDTLARSKRLEDLNESTSIGPDLADLGPGFVAVYTLVTKDALHLMVVSADASVARSVKVPEHFLNPTIAAFREALQDPERDPRSAGKELYDLLIAPIEQDLVQANAKVVLWSLDGALRYLPMNALYDGQRFVLERWPSAVFTPASKARMKDAPNPDWRILALGVAAAHPPFPALPAVAAELAGVVPDGSLTSTKAIDGAFTRDFLLAQLTRKWPVVHLASHFSFEPGDKDASYLLLGDGSHLTVGELERMPNIFQGVDLLTLSACNTATGDIGDGAEVESFAVLAQRKGARAVFASLWPVADQSTSTLMRRFYALRASAPSKLDALRQAQLELAQGTTPAPAGTTRARPLVAPSTKLEETPDDLAPTPSTQLDPSLSGWRHPYYWAPFILVGNVR